MTSEKLIKVAVVIGAHGIKGEVKLRSFVQNPDFFKKNISLSDMTGKKKFSIKVVGQARNAIIAKIGGVKDRNVAEFLKNMELFVAASVISKLDDGEFYLSKLVDLEARLETGERIGVITAIHNYGAGDIVEITKEYGKTEMLPLTRPWVREINIEHGYVVITPAEYL